MNSAAPRPAQTPSPSLTGADHTILVALNRFHYLTAAQTSRLLYPRLNDENRYSQRRLARLVSAGYVLRLRALPAPRMGSAPHVFTLGRRGRQHLSQAGIAVGEYFRPSEEQQKSENQFFMAHTLAVVDVLVAASRLCQSLPQVSLPRLLTERQLRGVGLRVVVPAVGQAPARTTTVIPDAWFQLQVGAQAPVSIALELDRGTEDQKRWRQKTAALAAWAAGPYRQVFASDNLTIAVVTPDPSRAAQLRGWIGRELGLRGLSELSQIFLVTPACPVRTDPAQFFCGPIWYAPGSEQALSILDPLPSLAPEAVEVVSGMP